MKPRASLALLPLTLLALGVSCAADRPRQEQPEPAPAAPVDLDTALLAPPPSALQGAVLVWKRVRDSGGEHVRLRGLESRAVVGQDDHPDRIHVKLDLVVIGSDAIQATGRYVSLLDDLSASTWCENVKRAPTRVLATGEALEVVGLEVLVQPPGSSFEADQRAEDAGLIATEIAVEMGLGSLDSRVATRQPTPGRKDTSYHLRPTDRRRSRTLETVLAFVTALEDRTATLSVTGLELRATRRAHGAEPLDEWTFKLVLTSRSMTKE